MSLRLLFSSPSLSLSLSPSSPPCLLLLFTDSQCELRAQRKTSCCHLLFLEQTPGATVFIEMAPDYNSLKMALNWSITVATWGRIVILSSKGLLSDLILQTEARLWMHYRAWMSSCPPSEFWLLFTFGSSGNKARDEHQSQSRTGLPPDA